MGQDRSDNASPSLIDATTGQNANKAISAPLSQRPFVPQMCMTFNKIYSHVLNISAFNHHLHFGDEEATLAWFHPQKTVGKNEFGSRGIVPGLMQLLKLPDKTITPETKNVVSDRFSKFAKEKSKKEFYTALSKQTNTSHILFMTFAHQLNRAEELISDRFRLAIYVDHFLFPLDNSEIKERHPSYQNRLNVLEASFKAEERMHGPRPEKFTQYLQFVAEAISLHRHRPGVIGTKMGFSYWRTYDVEPVDLEDARRIYETADTSPAAYKKLQDYLAFHVLQVCGEQNLPVQIHTGLGADPGLVLSNSNPSLLDKLLSRPELESTQIILIHGGYPFCKEIGVMARRKNVWLDFSWMPLLLPPDTLAGYLKEWIELIGPYEIIFGTDGGGLAMLTGTWCARRAVSIALSRMVEEGQITEAEAVTWARAILHGNAMRIYKETLAKN